MNLRYTLLAGVFAFVSLTSCEMKDELLNKTEESSEVGYLNVGLAVDASSQSITKASEATSTTPTVSATGFMVEIKKKGEEEAYKTFTYDGEMKPVELPVGDYTVYAHTPGNAEECTTAPYYGKEEAFSVKANEETGVNVVCTMMNMKIQLTYDEELKRTFKSWEISVTDGTHNQDFVRLETTADENVQQPDPFYWMIADNVTTIKVVFSGVLKDNNTEIRESRSIVKSSSSGSQNWGAADALSITIKPGEKDPADPSGVTGIEISANLEWNTDDKTDNIEVSVEDPTTPGEPGGEDGDGDGEESDGPTISFPKSTYSLPSDLKSNADATIKADAGLKSVKVQIVGGNPMFKNIIETLANPESGEEAEKIDFLNGEELVDNTTLGNIINSIAPGIPVLEKNATEYIFPVGSFFNTLNNMRTTTESEGHVFNITITDNNGRTTSGTLNVTVE
mgnify:CR=1 FL=1